MATTERDYYEILGVAREATDAEIKRSFRRLARELHPDVSEAPDAELRFREAAEAYEVLSDPERRATYDRFGHAGLRRGGFAPTEFGDLGDLFAAFFGDGLFGEAQRGATPSRGPDVTATDRDPARRGLHRDVRPRARSASPAPATRAMETAPRPVRVR